MFTVVAVTCARVPDAPGRWPACSSARYAVAVDWVSPIEMPDSTRAASRPGTLLNARKTIALAIARAAAGIRRRLRPYQSERWPARASAPTTPIAYAA